jgi:hypothetical protein
LKIENLSAVSWQLTQHHFLINQTDTMDFLASLNLHELPEQQSKINDKVSSALKANPEIRVSSVLSPFHIISHHSGNMTWAYIHFHCKKHY